MWTKNNFGSKILGPKHFLEHKFFGIKNDFQIKDFFNLRFFWTKIYWDQITKAEPSLKKKQENLGKIPKGGWGVKKQTKIPNFNLGILKTQGEVSIFQKCLNYKSGSDPILERRIEN